MKTTVSEKGQITIPKTVRDRLGIVPGTVLDIDAEAGRLIGTKHEPSDVFSRWRGVARLPGNASVDAYIERVRG